MNISRSLVLAGLLALAAPLGMSGSAWAQTCACGGVALGVRSEDPPPPMPEYNQPPMPAEGYQWTPGYWYNNNVDYYWVPGTWVAPPRPGVLWTPGYWALAEGVYVFNRGYWGPHVGFYGGVNYGFGYGGFGYHGGRWEGDHFIYNRAVNNFGSVHVANAYNEPVAEHESTSRASFNGAGGVAAKPTAEEEAAAHEQHEKPTSVQSEHLRAASVTPSALATNNHGKPAVAATSKAGTLTGPGVVKAGATPAAPAKTMETKPAATPAATPATPAKTMETKPAPVKAAAPVVEPKPAAPAPAKAAAPAVEPKAERPEPKAERPAPRVERPAPRVERPAPRAERPAPNRGCGGHGEPKC